MQQAFNAYGGAVLSSTQQANDSYALTWAAAACGTTVGAAMRNPQLIPALKLLCMPGVTLRLPPCWILLLELAVSKNIPPEVARFLGRMYLVDIDDQDGKYYLFKKLEFNSLVAGRIITVPEASPPTWPARRASR